MTKHSTRRALTLSVVALALCFTMLVGTTFAWFTDSVTSGNNVITAGNLDVEMYWADGTKAVPTEDDAWNDASEGAIFSYSLWEPGYVQVRHIKIENKGSLALQYKVNIVVDGEVTDLANVIDVYYVDPAVAIADRTQLSEDNYFGTLAHALNNLGTTGSGELKGGESDTITIALKMQESAGNDYMNKYIGSSFTIQLVATQLTYESDSFGPDYDAESPYPVLSNKVDLDAAGGLGDTTFNTDNVAVTVPAALMNELGGSIRTLYLVHSEPKIVGNSIMFGSVEFHDENGNVVDLEAINNADLLMVVLYVGDIFAEGDVVKIFHDDEEVVSVEVDANGCVIYEVLHFCEVAVTLGARTVTVSSVDEFIAALENVEPGTIIDATGVTIDINSAGYDSPGGIRAFDLPGGITIKGLDVTGSYRGGNYLVFGGTSDQEIVFEDCIFETVGRANGFGLVGDEGGVNSVVYNNCTFKGPIITNFVANPDGVATFNNCTITKTATGNNYVMAMGGDHIFNGCTFDYTGVTQSNMGTINAGCVNSTNDSSNTYFTDVVLNGCTRINCGTRKYGSQSTLTVK